MIKVNEEFCSKKCDYFIKVFNDMDSWLECKKYGCELKSYLVNINMEKKELIIRCEGCINYNFVNVEDHVK